jgi:hypothetical protein
LLSSNGDYVSKFVYIYEDLGTVRRTQTTTQELNALLYGLQERGAKILDVKISIVNKELGIARSFLIMYEAGNTIEL